MGDLVCYVVSRANGSLETSNTNGDKKMGKINEVISLNSNEVVRVDISRIEYSFDVTDERTPSRPTWMVAELTPAEIIANVKCQSVGNGVAKFTEDDLESYLSGWLEYHLNCGVKKFRWVWEKIRVCQSRRAVA